MSAPAYTSRAAPAPRVSVVIPNWNGAAVLPGCLDALAAQTFAPFEVVVVDNGSTDGSADRLDAWSPPAEVSSRTVRLPENVGFAAAVNRGVEASRGAFVAFLNSDAEPEPDWLAVLVDRFDARPEVGFCASKLVTHADPSVLDTAGHGFTTAGAGYARLRWAPDDARAAEEREVFGACAAASIYRREALDRVGPLDEAFFCYYEDLDLDLRLQLAGVRCLYVPAAVVRHRVSATSGGGRSAFIVYHSSRNQEWVYAKGMPGRLLWTRLPAHLLYNLGRFAVYLLKGRGWAFLRGKAAALRGLPRALGQRAAVQATRAVSVDAFAARLDPHWFRRHFLDHLPGRQGRG